eukprot:14501333-Alexandrium_andersonii.AAC.1
MQPALSGERKSGLLPGTGNAGNGATAGVHEPLVALEQRQIHAVSVAASHLLGNLGASVSK